MIVRAEYCYIIGEVKVDAIPDYIRIGKLETDIIVEEVNMGSSWIPKMSGIRLIHMPTKTTVQCIEFGSAHKNQLEARNALALYLNKIGYKSC